MNARYKMVETWQERAGVKTGSFEDAGLRMERALICGEESVEMLQALLGGQLAFQVLKYLMVNKIDLSAKPDEAAYMKERCDADWTMYGNDHVFGHNSDPAFDSLDVSNTTKVANGVVRDERGKVMKGPHYKPADIKALFESGACRREVK